MKKTLLAFLCSTLFLGGCATVMDTGGDIQAQQYVNDGAFQHAYTILAPNAKNGDPLADEQIGLMELNRGTRKDSWKLATFWLTQAAAHGDVDAMYDMAEMYRKLAGPGPANVAVRDYWYAQAASHGNLDAELALAMLYHQGDSSVPQNYRQAGAWELDLIRKSDGDLGTLSHPAPLMQAAFHLRPRRFAVGGAPAIRSDVRTAYCLLEGQYLHGEGVKPSAVIASAIDRTGHIDSLLSHSYAGGGCAEDVALRTSSVLGNEHRVAAGEAPVLLRHAQRQSLDTMQQTAWQAEAIDPDEQLDAQKITGDIEAYGLIGALKINGQDWPKPALPDIAAPPAPTITLGQALQAFQTEFGQ